jgi:hypothetical protein
MQTSPPHRHRLCTELVTFALLTEVSFQANPVTQWTTKALTSPERSRVLAHSIC